MDRLTGKEVNSVVAYIGGSGGYLGNFSYATHAEFYPMYCGLENDPNEYNGTTLQRFIKILTVATPTEQVKILQGVIDKYPLNYFKERLDKGFISINEFEKKKRLHKQILNRMKY